MFTTHCFIRKNTPELREKLEELGYEYNGCDSTYGTPNNLYCSFNSYYELSGTSKPSRYERIIDCRTNEELFLTLAALRDNTPIGSWYWFNGKLIKCETLELKNLSFNTAQYFPKCRDVNNPMICFCVDEKLLRKATINEIIEHFKDK